MSTSHLIPAGLTPRPAAESRHPGIPQNASDPILLGESLAVRRLRSQIQRIAPYFRIALICGEIGAGKQFAARAIHALSPSAKGPFIDAHASRLADAVDEAKHPQSATGAQSLLDAAEGGTLYLKGIGELSFAHQDALLRFLRDRWERRAAPSPGGHRIYDRRDPAQRNARYSGTRILAASHRDLGTLAAIGQFRQELYALLSAVEIVVPPLRQRAEDIPAIAASLLRHLSEQTGQSSRRFSDGALLHLREREWPNNLRDLERVVAQATALTVSSSIEPRHLLALAESPVHPSTANDSTQIHRLQDVIDRHVLEVLTRCGGNKLRAAELLGISRSTLYRMLDSRHD